MKVPTRKMSFGRKIELRPDRCDSRRTPDCYVRWVRMATPISCNLRIKFLFEKYYDNPRQKNLKPILLSSVKSKELLGGQGC